MYASAPHSQRRRFWSRIQYHCVAYRVLIRCVNSTVSRLWYVGYVDEVVLEAVVLWVAVAVVKDVDRGSIWPIFQLNYRTIIVCAGKRFTATLPQIDKAHTRLQGKSLLAQKQINVLLLTVCLLHLHTFGSRTWSSLPLCSTLRLRCS